MVARRFPPPRSVEETDACFIVIGHSLACVYFEDEPGRRSAAHLMTEARRIAERSKEAPRTLPLPNHTAH